MIHGFDVNSPLVCEGIIGDGCGGGRFFLVEDDILLAYDPTTKSKIFLDDNISNAKTLTKQACLLRIECEDEVINFDLSALKRL